MQIVIAQNNTPPAVAIEMTRTMFLLSSAFSTVAEKIIAECIKLTNIKNEITRIFKISIYQMLPFVEKPFWPSGDKEIDLLISVMFSFIAIIGVAILVVDVLT